jgi:hypothetical protein
MGLRCFVVEHAEKGMMVKTFRNRILKFNHLLFGVVQMEKDMHGLGLVKDHMPPLNVVVKSC